MTVGFQQPLILSHVAIVVPNNPSSAPVPQMDQTDVEETSFTLLVTGGVGPGTLLVDAQSVGSTFNGSPSSEYMLSSSGFSALVGASQAFNLGTVGYIPQGGISQQCYGDPACPLSFTFGVPEIVTFRSSSRVSYTFYSTVAGVPPLLAGHTLIAYSQISGVHTVFDSQVRSLTDATVVFQAVPEPATVWLFLLGFGLTVAGCKAKAQISR